MSLLVGGAGQEQRCEVLGANFSARSACHSTEGRRGTVASQRRMSMTTGASHVGLRIVIAVACLMGAVAAPASAGVATDRAASVVEFTKVISDGIHDTAIE